MPNFKKQCPNATIRTVTKGFFRKREVEEYGPHCLHKVVRTARLWHEGYYYCCQCGVSTDDLHLMSTYDAQAWLGHPYDGYYAEKPKPDCATGKG